MLGLAGQKWIACIWDEADRAEGGRFCGVELFAAT